jgi:hypothetical protein
MQRILRADFASLFLSTVFGAAAILSAGMPCMAQSSGNSGTITGTVADSTGAVIPGATIELRNPVSGYDRTAQSDASGSYQFTNIPFNNYHAEVTMAGFASQSADVQVRSAIPLVQDWKLAISSSVQTVNVQTDAGDLLENSSTFHTDVDRRLIDKLPLESTSSGVSSLVTLSTPGISADSNGLFHGLGDHAENSFSVDGQPITDQQSKVFSNQIPMDSIQSIQVISGAPPAEYGDKTSVVIDVTTRSGLGVTAPTGSVTASYGSFGSSNLGVNLAYGGKSWGNFIAANGSNSGRFLDPPEFKVIHDKGNEENLFDRVDYQFTPHDSFHSNLQYTRSWFQTPDSFDSENLGGVNLAGTPVSGPADQRSQIQTFNIAPTLSHIINDSALVSGGVYVRRDAYNYYPSADPFADLGPPNLQQETVAQQRTLTNTGAHAEFTYSHGINNIKAGTNYSQTFLNENFQLGIVDPNYLPNLKLNGSNPATPCFVNGVAIGPPCTYLLPYDLTRGGTDYDFAGHTDVKELALYVEDAISKGNWAFNLGIRGDYYNGLTVARQAEPRLGLSYNFTKTNTILRASYARTLETPFNENLILSSVGCANDVLNPLLLCGSSTLAANPLSPGFRNEFHAGFQQAFSRYLVISGEYITKYTHNGYDFSVLGATPITFPIEWHNSKIPGYAGRISVPEFHGFSVLTVMSSVAARFFTPQIGGAGATPGAVGAFRIDHDEKFNQTTHLQYQPRQMGPWMGFNWRFDSGQVAGSTPCYNVVDPNSVCSPFSTTLNGQPAIILSGLTSDQQFQAGLTCGTQRASVGNPLPGVCLASQFGSTLIKIPAANLQDNDHNPQRIASRSLFDLALGDDKIFPKLFRFKNEQQHVSGNVTVVNLANKYALYNFLSTFSGTHYVTPRNVTATLAFNF